MNVTNEVAFATVVSVLGYCILPIVGLAALGVVFSLQGWLGTGAAVGAVMHSFFPHELEGLELRNKMSGKDESGRWRAWLLGALHGCALCSK